MGTPDDFCPIYGSRQWEILNEAERDELGHHLGSWLFSQFLHGEQGALTVAARIVESVPDMDSKFYAATQTMDEARHVELYSRFMREKIGLYYPINDGPGPLLADALSDSRWDLPYLGMQVLIEGLALAAFGVHRDIAANPLVKQLLAYVMQDEARHVAFGRLALRDYYAGLTEAERADREEFVVEGCYLMRNRFRAQEVWERMGYDVAECLEFTEHSPVQQAFRTLLFSRIVPCVKDIGLWGPKVQHAYADLGVLDAANSDLDALMRDDEEIAERIDRRRRQVRGRAGRPPGRGGRRDRRRPAVTRRGLPADRGGLAEVAALLVARRIMNCGHVGAGDLGQAGRRVVRSRIRYSPGPGSFTRRVGRTSVQSRWLARITSSIARTSANGLARMRGRIILTSRPASGSSRMNAPAAETTISRRVPVLAMAAHVAAAASSRGSGAAGAEADSTASARPVSATAPGRSRRPR